MNDEQVFELAERNSFQDDSGCWIFKDEGLLDFVFMVKKAEQERVAKWMMEQGYATGHGDTIEELLKELEWQAAEREREACAKLCDEQSDKDGFEGGYANECAELIRSRGIDGAKVGEVGIWGDSKALAESANSTTNLVEPKALAQPEQKTPLKVLNLTVFTENRLRNGRVYDVETLQGMTNRDILAIPDMGKKALAEVLEALAKLKEKNGG